MKRLYVTILWLCACTLCAASEPPEFTIRKLRDHQHNHVRAMEIHNSEGRIVHFIGMRGHAWQCSPPHSYADSSSLDPRFWQLDLAYGRGAMPADLKPWDPIPIPDVPALAVLEHRVGGSHPRSHHLLFRVILYENGSFRELPPVEGGGEVFLFHDFNENGSMELAITDLLYWHERNEDGLPLSPHVFWFNGTEYVPVTEERTWDGVSERYRKWHEERRQEAEQER